MLTIQKFVVNIVFFLKIEFIKFIIIVIIVIIIIQ